MARGKLEPGMKQWQPGQSGNPSGRPKKDHSHDLAELVFTGLSVDDAAKALRKVLIKNPKMFQVLADRAFGKFPQTVNLSGQIDVSVSVAERLKAARKRVEEKQ